jgi:DNA-binding response OmpR family regulator
LSLDVLVDAVNRAVHRPVRQPFTSSSPQALTAHGESGESILVVDDEPMVRDLLIRFLTLRGFHARGAQDGAEALSMITADPPDLVLVDLVMPGMSGVEVLEALRAKHFAGAVVVLSDSHCEDLLDQAWALGPQEALSKPIDLDRLLTVVQLVLVCREC